MTSVDIWVLPAEHDLDERCLAGSEQQHAAAHRSPAAASRHRRGRALLRHAVAQCRGVAPGAVPLRPPSGRGPVVGDGLGGLRASIAHRGDIVVVALSDDGPVGVDVEVAGSRVRPVPRLVATPSRCDAVAHLVEPALRPLAVWVVLEAALKAAGTGFTQPHREARVDGVPDGVHVDLPTGGLHGCRLHRLPGGVLVAVATPVTVPMARWHTASPGSDRPTAAMATAAEEGRRHG